MSDNSKTNANQAPKAESEELKPNEQEKISGGLTIDGIKGESQDDKHKDWIEILSYKP
jgi:hypothetical protein